MSYMSTVERLNTGLLPRQDRWQYDSARFSFHQFDITRSRSLWASPCHMLLLMVQSSRRPSTAASQRFVQAATRLWRLAACLRVDCT